MMFNYSRGPFTYLTRTLAATRCGGGMHDVLFSIQVLPAHCPSQFEILQIHPVFVCSFSPARPTRLVHTTLRNSAIPFVDVDFHRDGTPGAFAAENQI